MCAQQSLVCFSSPRKRNYDIAGYLKRSYRIWNTYLACSSMLGEPTMTTMSSVKNLRSRPSQYFSLSCSSSWSWYWGFMRSMNWNEESYCN